MSAVGEAFVAGLGTPDPATPNGLHFEGHLARRWQRIHGEIGSGWFKDGFLYLFGEDVAALQPCLDAWSFLVPPADDRMILGRNIYGAVLVLDHVNDPQRQRILILDPFTVTYDGDPNLHLLNMIGNWLPGPGWYGRGEVPTFLDDRAYQQWRREHDLDGVRLDADEVLGIKVPRALGGTLSADNLQLENIVDYYQSTAPIYAAAFATLNRQ